MRRALQDRAHLAGQRTEEEARRWALGSDERNAAIIRATRSRADLVARLDGQLPQGG
jgi:predicted Fe-S protein YdhL (DUF1289 family)